VKTRLALFVTCVVTLWVIVAYPARYLGGNAALAYSAVAALLCLVPTVATMAWAGWALEKSPEQQLLMMLGGTGVRMAVVLAGGLALYLLVPFFHQRGFWLWILVFYLLTLALEMLLIVAGRHASDRPQSQP
jgi:hypothetical protein